MKKGTILYGAVCFALGAALCGGTAAYAAGVTATRSTNTIYVDGEQVELEAYLINGSNYIKLRDVGQVVGFNVYWNEENRTVQIESDRPYTGVAPEEQVIDDASIANPAIFTGAYTREAYNALRASVVNGSPSSPVTMSQETRDVMREVVTEFGEWPVYRLKVNGDGQSYFTPDYPDGYKGAVAVPLRRAKNAVLSASISPESRQCCGRTGPSRDCPQRAKGPGRAWSLEIQARRKEHSYRPISA